MNQIAQRITQDGEIVEQSPGADMAMVVGLTRAEIDQQIATARQFPRSITRATENIMGLATLNEPTADSCMYAVPRAGKTIEGPSIRFAEIVQQNWGNNRVAARVVFVDKDEKYLEAEGVYHDLETNAATMARVRRRISGKDGKVFNDDMILMTGNAACSIARRNAILAGVPKPIWSAGYDEARKVVMGDIKTLSNRRAEALKYFQKFGVSAEHVFKLLEVRGEQDIDLEKMVTLKGMANALRTGEATPESIFGDILKLPEKPSAKKPKKGDFDKKGEGKDGAAPEAQTQPTQEGDKPPAQEQQADKPVAEEDRTEFGHADAHALGRQYRREKPNHPMSPPADLDEQWHDSWKDGWRAEDDDLRAEAKTAKKS
jgi:hypothetical protein